MARNITELESGNIDQILSLEENLTFSDALVALRIMREQFPQIDKPIQPFILRSQLYSSVEDRTQVDRDLETLRREKVLRIFILNTGQDDHAIMFLDDYLCQVDRVVKRLEGEKEIDTLEVFKWFRSHVVDSKLEPSIEHQELCSLLSLGGKVKDAHISLLMNSGLLTRQLIDPNIYWFAIPNIGTVLKGLSQSTNFLNWKIFTHYLLKRLRFSSLDMRFHLRDLIGSGHLKTVQIPTGIVVRVSKD
ncbi:uncharacterized protein LOC126783396 [Argentina anserina]|uniref:uncharacterized protein LOC126783396 n=1 Tax=Argentina anserina TaxID=57926 RepID=UPI0021763C61|nr:uncharacterized protein LOC126783396 [Potentilla anserina]